MIGLRHREHRAAALSESAVLLKIDRSFKIMFAAGYDRLKRIGTYRVVQIGRNTAGKRDF